MSSDQNPPGEWWNQPQEPKKNEGHPADQGSQDDRGYGGGQGQDNSQRTQEYPVNRGYQEPPAAQRYPADQGYQDSQGTQHYPAGQGYQDSQAAQRYPGGQGFQDSQRTQRYPAGQDPQATQRYPGGYQEPQQDFPAGQGFPAAQGYQGTPVRTRRRRRKWPYITLIVVILVLVVGDRVAAAFTEDQMASQVQSSLELSGKPKVVIQGIPFLTQLAARDFNTVDITASNETAGPGGQLEIASLTATLHGMHIHGFNSATIDQFNASALITFTALANAGGIPQGITLSADGPNKIKASLDIGPLSETAEAQITKVGPGKINIKVIGGDNITSAVLGNLDFTVSIPKLPAGVSIQTISVTQQGLRITAAGKNTTLSQ